MKRVKRLIEITPSQLKLYEAIGRDFPDLSPAQAARIVAIVRKWMHDEVHRVKAEIVSGNFMPKTADIEPRDSRAKWPMKRSAM
jgi:hypothetical protein